MHRIVCMTALASGHWPYWVKISLEKNRIIQEDLNQIFIIFFIPINSCYLHLLDSSSLNACELLLPEHFLSQKPNVICSVVNFPMLSKSL